ncbi:helicase [Auricularia subglabra TFB-10046 SS5]|uniref:ATP-dependent DNA helicase n=1 Tax=Auricularia subglabra (strain TFB-10046 / SS5) TaxID=717982 RepID=J0D6N3_AURST|nr:helicase [Auricularia subglabra TFB-10046 SS5]
MYAFAALDIQDVPRDLLAAANNCPHCGIELLTGKTPGFCCGPSGDKLREVAPLPPLPSEFSTFVDDPRVSSLSRLLNLVYTFAQLESTHQFPEYGGMPAHFAVQGRIYHRVRPDHINSAIRWLLYDGFMRGTVPHSGANWFVKLPTNWIDALGAALLRVNPFVHYINVFRQHPQSNVPDVQLLIREAGCNEIAGIMCFENTIASDAKPLVYPLFFPHGTLGWGRPSAQLARGAGANDDDAITSQLWHCRARLLREERFAIFGRLTNEYLVDMFTRNIESRLAYIRAGQLAARREDAALMGVDIQSEAENVFLPASFLGSNAWCSQQIADALTIAANCGVPTFFITMTCNPDWPEIREKLRPGQTWADVPIVVVRVFKQKLAVLLRTLKTMFPNAGKVFQKRGLPHCHILIKFEKDCLAAADIDRIVSAEMPSNPTDAALVHRFMRHNHPDETVLPEYCRPRAHRFAHAEVLPENQCCFGYPKPVQEITSFAFDGRPHYRRRNTSDSMIVPHCLPLLRALECHINFEVANSSHIFQYLFKYIRKGVDKAHVRLRPDGTEVVDEIDSYWRARYLSAGEAAWRIMGYHVSSKYPGVTGLPVHLATSRKHRQYQRVRSSASNFSLLDRYFHRPDGTFQSGSDTVAFAELTYAEFYTKFRHIAWDRRLIGTPGVYEESGVSDADLTRLVLQRTDSHRHFVRISSVKPSQGELFYFRAILLNRPASSFLDARTFGSVVYPMYQEAAQAMGLFADRNEAQFALHEAIESMKTPRQVRLLFVHLIIHDSGEVDFPLKLWELFHDELSMDFYYENGGMQSDAYSRALQELAMMLEEFGRSLDDFALPQPTSFVGEVAYELDRWAPHLSKFRNNVSAALRKLTPEQLAIFREVVSAVENDRPLLLFVNGKAGRGKTFLISAICDYVRSRSEIVLPTATSAFAALLYEGGRTMHSCFKIPVEENNELLRSPIEQGDSRAQLLQEFRVLIWDEAPMANRAALACVEETCRRVTGDSRPFGGKIVILAGDFRQTCPVVRRGTRAQVVDASIRRSPLWELFSIRRLTVPIRNAEDSEYSAWVDTIGDGAGPQVPLNLLRHVHTENEMIDFVYPQEIINDPKACLKRSILCPTNRQIDQYNAQILDRVHGIARTYLSADKIKEEDEAGMPERGTASLDYAARAPLPGLPGHSVTIKTNAVFRLLRNFSISRGLVKNVRVVIVDVGVRLITVRVLRDTVAGVAIDGEDILIPRITFETFLPETRRTLQRRQFPLAPAYTTTFNSCQGLTLDVVAMDLCRPVFSHGQLYTAVSRVRRREHAIVRLPVGQGCAENVTYTEILL